MNWTQATIVGLIVGGYVAISYRAPQCSAPQPQATIVEAPEASEAKN
ncbi:MAG: hypothetical protein F6J95_023390 [Leptolyngbya sp. SIO1E4]|nr:hypothetical protein [Leptolyngbya sp. SIO1E4]